MDNNFDNNFSNNSNDNNDRYETPTSASAGMRILNMLEEGKINAAEATELLKQFKEAPEPQDGALSHIGSIIGEALGEVEDFFNFTREHKVEFTMPAAQSIGSVRLLGKNGKVELESYNGQEVRIECKYKPKKEHLPPVMGDDPSAIELLYDASKMRSMSIKCLIPNIFVDDIVLESRNGAIRLNRINSNSVQLTTKNSDIKMKDVKSNELVARTRNAPISAERITADTLSLYSSNSSIQASRIKAVDAKLMTSNAKVDVEYHDVERLVLSTSNAAIKLDRVDMEQPWPTERVIEAETSNAAIKMTLPDVGFDIEAETSNARIDIDLPFFPPVSGKFLKGRSQDYNERDRQLRLKLSTSNGGIKLESAK